MLSLLLGNLPGLAYRCTVAAPWVMEYVSEGAEALTGHSSAEFLSGSVTWRAVTHPDDFVATESEIASAVAEKRQFTLTYRVLHRTGAEKWVLERGEAIYDEAGTAVALEGFISDVTEQKQAEQRLRESEEHYRHTVEHLPQMPWTADPFGNIVSPNLRWAERTGRPIEAALGQGWLDAVHPDDVPGIRAAMTEALRNSGVYDVKYRLAMADGSYRWVQAQAYPRRNDAGEIIRWYGTNTDIHQQVISEARIRESEEHYRYTVELSPHMPWTADRDGKLLTISSRWLDITGLSIDDTLARGWLAAVHPDDLPASARQLKNTTRSGSPIDMRHRVRCADGSYRWMRARGSARRDERGEIIRWYGLTEDIHDQVLAEERITWAAQHDPLTGLPNRSLFNQRLADALDRGARDGSRVGLLLLDLDHLKRLNDAMGHDAGDALLRTFANRLRLAVRATDTVARLGGDEFGIVLPSMPADHDCEVAAKGILDRIREPFGHDGREIDCSASIGVAVAPLQGPRPEELLKNADLALYAAKSAGRNMVRMFNDRLRADARRRTAMIGQARDAIRQDLVVPFYQPKVVLGTGEIAGFEALLRWYHPRIGLQAPQNIAAAFQDNETAAALTERMLGRVIADMRRWLDAGLPFRKVAVNASAADFRREGFGDGILERLRRAAIPAHHFELEMTEHVFLGRGARNVERTLDVLSSAGVTIALDDFGTGYASLAHLRQFPVDVIKIDRQFVRRLSGCSDNAAIVRAVVGLGHSLGIITVAEGIETQAQLDRLVQEGCHQGQGYLFSRAVPASRVGSIFDGISAERSRRFG
jgi:diguanylate cyclase (GGDEF)-like protein/PAS domain S-box-containing protein